jgi:ABC-type transport system involved in multi-copper enzyme maturation permease subunit
MISPVAATTFSECVRRPFPYAVAVVIILLSAASRLFLGFSFGADVREIQNIGLSAVFLAGLGQAAFVGTTLVRRDLERGTLGLVLSKPIHLADYVIGRYLGLLAATIVVSAAVALGVSVVIWLLPAERAGATPFDASLFHGWLRVLVLVAVLNGAALAASACATRVVAPLLLVGLFLAGSIAGGSAFGFFLPDFALFGLEVRAKIPWGTLTAYGALFCAIFLVVTYILLASRATLRRSG